MVVGKQGVGVFRRHPVRDIGFDKGASWQAFARLPQHVGGGIDADHRGLRPPPDQKLGGIARSATDVDDLARLDEWDLRQQIARRPGPLVFEFEILLRAPVRHLSYRVSFLYFTRCGMIESWPSRRILSFS